ncbi:MAG: hypothetical protein ABIV25_08145 [Paracoccaceae bacterium]
MSSVAAFLIALKLMESGGDYQSVNSLNFLGAYQFGEAALTDLGFVRYDGNAYDNNYGGGWTGKYGVKSATQFLASDRVQDKAMEEWLKVMWGYIELQKVDRYAWKQVGGEQLTPSGMLAATHLLGAESLARYVRSDGKADLRDPYGTPISSYIAQLNGYDIPFAPREMASN